MNVPHEINRRAVKLIEILGETNTALIEKNSIAAKDMDGVPESIEEIQISSGIQPDDLVDTEVISANEDRIVPPPEGKGYANIRVKGEPNLYAENIAKGRTLFGITGIYPRLDDLATINIRSQANDFWVSAVEDTDYANYPGIGRIQVLGEPNLQANVVLNGKNIFGVVGNYKVQSVKNITLNSTGYTNVYPDNASSMERVRVYVNVPQQTLNKKPWSVTINSQGWYNAYPTRGEAYNGTGEINIYVNVPQNIIYNQINASLASKNFTISKFPQTYYASNYGYDGFNKVTIKADSSLTAANIKSGVTVLGVTGTFAGNTTSTFVNSITVNSKNYSQTINANSSTYNADGFRQIVIPAQPNLTPGNIVNGVTICGVVGNYTRSDAPKLQNKWNIIPTINGTTVRKDSGYDGLDYVTTKPEPNLSSQYIAQNKTIFGIKGSYQGELQDVLHVYPNENDLEYGPEKFDTGKQAVKKVYVHGTGKIEAGDWQQGYNDGVAASQSTIDQLEREKQQLQDSFESGQEQAYENGKKDGIAIGEQNSYEEIYLLNEQVNQLEKDKVTEYERGKEEGKEEGKSEGYDEGYDKGFVEGLDEGKKSLTDPDENIGENFTEVRYLAMYEGQCINLGYTPTQDFRIEFEYQNLSLENSNPGVFGSRNTTKGDNFALRIIDGYYEFGFGKQLKYTIPVDRNWHIFELNKREIFVDKQLVHTFSEEEFQTKYSIFLGAIYASTGMYYNKSGYYGKCKLYDGDTLIRDLIPCMNNTTQLGGYYDKVSGAFFFGNQEKGLTAFQ